MKTHTSFVSSPESRKLSLNWLKRIVENIDPPNFDALNTIHKEITEYGTNAIKSGKDVIEMADKSYVSIKMNGVMADAFYMILTKSEYQDFLSIITKRMEEESKNDF